MAKLTSGGMYLPNAQRSNLSSGGWTAPTFSGSSELTLTAESIGKLSSVLKGIIDDGKYERYCASMPLIMSDGTWVQPIGVDSLEVSKSYGWGQEISATVSCGAYGYLNKLPEDVRRKIDKIYKNAAIAALAVLQQFQEANATEK